MPRDHELNTIAGVSLSLLQYDLPRFLSHCKRNPQSFGKYTIPPESDYELFKLDREDDEIYDIDDKQILLFEQINRVLVKESKINYLTSLACQQIELAKHKHK